MKKLFLLVVLLLMTNNLSAQWQLNLSMGLDFKSSPAFRDYINTSFAFGNSLIPSFKSAVSFSGEANYKLSETFALGLEENLQIDSYSASYNTGGLYEISYIVNRPSLFAYYIVPGNGYQFRFGAGVGPRFVSLSEKINTSSDYTASGYGLVLKAEGNTFLSRNFYALIGTNLRYDVTGDISSSQNTILNRSTGEKLNLNSISLGIYLGVSFIL